MKEATKRYDRYPALAALARGMSPEGRQLVTMWHLALITGLTGFLEKYTEGSMNERLIARRALREWLRVMQQTGNVLADLRPADWCCPTGAVAYPVPCPQHGGPVNGQTRPLGSWGRAVWVDGSWYRLAGKVDDRE